MNYPEIEPYTPYEKMNMLRTGARTRRLKTLYKYLGLGHDKVINNFKVENINTVIKRTQRQSNIIEMEDALNE